MYAWHRPLALKLLRLTRDAFETAYGIDSTAHSLSPDQSATVQHSPCVTSMTSAPSLIRTHRLQPQISMGPEPTTALQAVQLIPGSVAKHNSESLPRRSSRDSCHYCYERPPFSALLHKTFLGILLLKISELDDKPWQRPSGLGTFSTLPVSGEDGPYDVSPEQTWSHY